MVRACRGQQCGRNMEAGLERMRPAETLPTGNHCALLWEDLNYELELHKMSQKGGNFLEVHIFKKHFYYEDFHKCVHTHKVERKTLWTHVSILRIHHLSKFCHTSLPTPIFFLSYVRDNWSLKFQDMCSRGEILWIVPPWCSPTLPWRTPVSILLLWHPSVVS